MPTITMSGLGSGLDYNSWIESLVGVEKEKIEKVNTQAATVKSKQSALDKMEGYYKNLQEVIKSFSSILTTDNIFSQKSVTSNSEALTAKVDANANVQNLSVSVSQLATSTVAQSSFVAAKAVGGTTLLSDISSGTVNEGTFSVYVNGQKNSIDIAKTDSLDDVMTKLNNIDGIAASLSDEGKLSIASEDSSLYKVSVGSSSDTSNFSNVMSLARNAETGTYTSSKSIFETNVSAELTSAKFSKDAVTEGTFTIGDVEFEINDSTTMESLIKDINKSTAGVSAYWDSNAGKMVLTSTEEGATNINIEAGTSNFTDVMGFTTSSWNEDGSLAATSLNEGSQTLGSNAVLTINGTTITSTTNTVTSDISGISGLTLTLNKETESSAKIDVTQDTAAVDSAIKSFTEAFNNIMTATDTATDSKTGLLYGESLLISLKNSIRKTATSSIGTEGDYNSLAKIGITTGAFSSDTSKATNQLEINSEKLLEALKSDPDAVKNLFTGEQGIFTKMQTTIDNALDVQKGYFASRDKTFNKEISTLDKKVTKMEDSLENYQARLEAKFQAMDEIISNLQNQASVFDSYFNKKDKDD